ncbi:hypothetical protein [Candidatus Burkholderia verschuerenii]|uniref:hypothetical protein n=1 Tax=Candidatus Burkholderia verschuerenii TaxID=242163 RepID=UPI001E3272C3|nr:hypothetical protein [Candidatus Burkholderia verschuerenii]
MTQAFGQPADDDVERRGRVVRCRALAHDERHRLAEPHVERQRAQRQQRDQRARERRMPRCPHRAAIGASQQRRHDATERDERHRGGNQPERDHVCVSPFAAASM